MIRENGNVLFLILIAVALFAALSYAITSSSRGGGSLDREQAEVYASQMMQMASQLEQGIQRIMVISGCSDTDIDFWQDSNGDLTEDYLDYYGRHPSNPTASVCYIYESEGGNIPNKDKNVNPNMLDAKFSAETGYGKYIVISSTQVTNIGSTCDAPECSELMFYVRFVKKEVCEAISYKAFGTRNIYQANVGSATYHGNYTMDGNYEYYGFNDNGKLGSGLPDEVNLIGKTTGCIRNMNGVNNDYTFYHVLLAR